jgi:CHAT domain-containing protein/Tfp pilus assembly protein PilF
MKTQAFLCIALLASLFSCATRSNSDSAQSPDCDAATMSASLAQIRATDSVPEKAALLESVLVQLKDCDMGTYRDSIAEEYRKTGNSFWDTDWDEARKYYHIGLSLQPAGMVRGRLYCNIGLSYHSERDYDSALPFLDSALFVQPVFPNSPYYFNAANFLGDCYLKLGQPHLAEQYVQRALELATENNDPGQIAAACEFMSNCKRALHRYAEAIEAGQKGILLSASDIGTLANCYHNTGNAWQDSLLHCPRFSVAWQSASDSTAYYYSKARSLYSGEEQREHELTLISNLGELYRRRGDAREAGRILARGLDLLDTVAQKTQAESRLLGRLYINRGEALMDAGVFSAAESDFDSALHYLAPTYLPASGTPLQGLDGPTASPELVIMAINDKAALTVKKGKNAGGEAYVEGLKTALAHYEVLAAFSNNARKEYLTEADKISLAHETRPYLDSAFLICLELEKRTAGKEPYRKKAFEFAEQSRAMALLEMLQSKNSSATLSESQLEKRRELLKEQEELTGEIFKNRNNHAQLAVLKEQWLEQMSHWRQFQESLSSASKQQFKTVETLQQDILGEDQALLAYHKIDSFLYILLLKKADLKLIAQPIDASFYEDLAGMHQLLSGAGTLRFNSLKEKEHFLCTTSKRLYDRLFPAEVAAALPERIIIVPNDDLHSLPFDALWTSTETGGLTQLDQRKHYLLFRHAVSYAPSANLLWEMQHGHHSKKRAALAAAFAPRFPENLQMGNSNLPQAVEGTIGAMLAPLPNEEEVGSIGKVISIKKFTGANATKENFWEACKRYNVIHIPTHGVLYNEDPRFNFICFSQMLDSLDADELLYMHELYNREERLNLEMVVFAACETAAGPHVKSEGNMSMARGLAAAGVRSFVTTLWKINSADTKRLMPAFYKALTSKKDTPKDLALAQAKREYVNSAVSGLNPQGWAGVVLIGDAGHLPLKRAGMAYGYLGLLLLIPAAVAGRRALRRRFAG